MAASSNEIFFTDPVICYFLDTILVVYCIVATALFFREKFSHIPSAAVEEPEENERIYQELQKIDDEHYQVIEPSKRKKKAAKKNKSESAPAEEEKDPEPSESLIPSGSTPPPLSPH